MNFFLVLILLSIQIACGGSSQNSIEIGSDDLDITITNARSFNPNIDHGKIVSYRVTVTGTGMKKITKLFPGEVTHGRILGIPAGDNRQIAVEAVNANGLVIRRGQREGVVIVKKQLTQVELSLNAVPIFTNITDKSAVAERRAFFGVFGEPGSSLRIVSGDEATSIDTSSPDGLFHFDPPSLDLGVHTFRVEDEETHEFSQVTVSIHDSLTRPGLAVESGGSTEEDATGEGRFLNLGQGLAADLRPDILTGTLLNEVNAALY